MKPQKITGIVLAGGKSSRMGADKSLMVWKNKSLVEHAIDTLKPFCYKVIISSNHTIYDYTGCETWPDIITQQAPIIGIYSCLKRSETELNIILSCDMPLIGIELINYLLEHSKDYDIIVPSHAQNFLEPLCGIYKKSISAEMDTFINDQNLSLNQFIKKVIHFIVPIHSKLPFYKSNMFSNINSMEDYNKLSQT